MIGVIYKKQFCVLQKKSPLTDSGERGTAMANIVLKTIFVDVQINLIGNQNARKI